MTIAHEGSTIALRNGIKSLPEGMILFPLDGRLFDTTNFIPIVYNRATFIRQNESKFSGSVAVDPPTTNLVANSDLSDLTTASLGWDRGLNGYVVPASGWSSGYNSGVPNPSVGYHAHINTSLFGFPVMEFIDKNSQFDPSLKHRWLGFSQLISSNVSTLGWGPDTKVTVSFDMMVDHIDKGTNVGLYHKNPSGTSTFGDDRETFFCTRPWEWERKYVTFTLSSSEWLYNDFCSIYVYGNNHRNDYEGIAWVTNIQVETGPFPTSYTKTSRVIDRLQYDISSLGMKDAGCISCWIYNSPCMVDNLAGNDQYLIKLGSNSSNWYDDTVNLSIQIDVNPLKYRFWTRKGTSGDNLIFSNTSVASLGKGTWNHFVIQWDKNGLPSGNTKELYINGVLEASSTTTELPQNVLTHLFLGHWDGFSTQHMPSTRFEQLAIHPSKGFSPKEIRSWYEAQAPFYDVRDTILFY